MTTLKHGTILYETPGLATFPASVCGLARVFDRVQIVGKAGFFLRGGGGSVGITGSENHIVDHS